VKKQVCEIRERKKKATDIFCTGMKYFLKIDTFVFFGQEQKWGGIKPVNRIPTPLFGIRIKSLLHIFQRNM
jgi:hypothetical protein